MRTLEDLMAESPMFAGLDPRLIALVAGCGRTARAAEGRYLFRQGDDAERFFLIRQGIVALEIDVPGGDPVVVETLHAGEVAGWSWLFAPYRWQFDGRAATDCALIAFDGVCLRGKGEADHELGFQLMRRFAGAVVDRLQHTRLQLLDVYARPAHR